MVEEEHVNDDSEVISINRAKIQLSISVCLDLADMLLYYVSKTNDDDQIEKYRKKREE